MSTVYVGTVSTLDTVSTVDTVIHVNTIGIVGTVSTVNSVGTVTTVSPVTTVNTMVGHLNNTFAKECYGKYFSKYGSIRQLLRHGLC